MDTDQKWMDIDLAVIIVDFGLGSKVLKMAQQHGIQYNTVLIGRGTLNNRILEFLHLADVRKEIVLLAAEKTTITTALHTIDERFHFDKPFHGIAFTMPLHWIMAQNVFNLNINTCTQQEGSDPMYQMLTIIADKGKAEQIMECATKAGARGGTILKARSAGNFNDHGSLFGIDIESEKEVLLILTKTSIVKTITDALREAHFIGTDQDAIVICQEVTETYGLK